MGSEEEKLLTADEARKISENGLLNKHYELVKKLRDILKAIKEESEKGLFGYACYEYVDPWIVAKLRELGYSVDCRSDYSTHCCEIYWNSKGGCRK